VEVQSIKQHEFKMSNLNTFKVNVLVNHW